MNKVKKVWMENKVLLVLAIILLFCIGILSIVSLTYFYGSSDNVYGNRLDSTKKVSLNKKLFIDIKNELEVNESVINAEAKLKGKIVYIDINFEDGTKMEDAKIVAEKTIDLFNDDELSVYDLQFIISASGNAAYTLMGARNSNGSGKVVWNNYTIIETDKGSAEN